MSDSSGDSDGEEWHEEESMDDANQFDCLFCPALFNCIEDTMEHCSKAHNIRFDTLNKKFPMDCYSFIKFINFVRRTNLAPDVLLNTQESLWDDETNLKPVKECDPWLMFGRYRWHCLETSHCEVVSLMHFFVIIADVEDYFESHKCGNDGDTNGDTQRVELLQSEVFDWIILAPASKSAIPNNEPYLF